MATGTVHNEGADIAYYYQGDGPLLLLIADGIVGGGAFAPSVRLLAEQFTVVSYDRRCNGKSTGDPDAELDPALQARDAAAVLRAVGDGPAYVFGACAGAVVGLQLATDHPECVRGLVAHEPPIVRILPDADRQLMFHQEVHRTFLEDGPLAARALFTTGVFGARAAPTPRDDIAGAEVDIDDGHYFWEHEHLPLVSYRPDIDRIRAHGVPAVLAVGRESDDLYFARTARLLGTLLGSGHTDFPGGHLGHFQNPAGFARALRAVLGEL